MQQYKINTRWKQIARYTVSQPKDANGKKKTLKIKLHIFLKFYYFTALRIAFKSTLSFKDDPFFQSKNDHWKQAQWPQPFGGRKGHCKIMMHQSGEVQANLPNVSNP